MYKSTFLIFLCSAHVMPKAQLYAQLTAEWGDDWMDRFESFDEVPIAAASIGQVVQNLRNIP